MSIIDFRRPTVFTDPPAVAPPLWTALPRAAWPFLVALAFALVMQFAVAPHINQYIASVMINCGIWIILAISLTVVNGFTGQFSIGHAGFLCLGGYVAAAVVYYGTYHFFGDFDFHGGRLSFGGIGASPTAWFTWGDTLFLAACLVGALVCAGVGWLVGLPSLRLRGDYLAIVTLGFGEIICILMQSTPEQLSNWSDTPITDVSFPKQFIHLGGALGFFGNPVYTTMFWVWLFAAITLVVTIRLKYSGYGRAMLSIREDEIAAQAVGVNITRLKVRAFVYSAFIAGFGGGLYAMNLGTINSADLGFQKSFDLVIMVVLGGMGSISGAAIAAVILTVLQELLQSPPSLWPWGFVAAAVLAVMIYFCSSKPRKPLIVLASLCVIWETMRWVAQLTHQQLSDYRMVIYALALIVMMILRPQGFFGTREIWSYLPRWRRRRDAR